MAGISSAGGELKLPIGESPRSIRPDINRELQSVYNALHISNAYLTALREEFEGSDAQDPAESLKFRRTYTGVAGAAIQAGNVCCAIGNAIYPGVGTTSPSGTSAQPALQLWHRSFPRYTGLRSDFGLRELQFNVALEAAAPGAPVKVGIGPGVIRVPGTICGQLLWAREALGLVARASTVNGGPFGLFLFDRPVVGDGALFTSNPTGASDGQAWERVNLPGYPFQSGDWAYRGSSYFHPVAICIRNDYVYFFDYKVG